MFSLSESNNFMVCTSAMQKIPTNYPLTSEKR